MTKILDYTDNYDECSPLKMNVCTPKHVPLVYENVKSTSLEHYPLEKYSM